MSLGVSLPLLSPQRANHVSGLFWDPFHFCNSLGYAEQKGQIAPLQNEIVMASLFPSLVCTSSFFSCSSCLWWSRRNMFCFALFLCLFLHTDRFSASCPHFTPSHLPPRRSQIQRRAGSRQAFRFPTGALPAMSIALLPTNTVLCVLEGGVSAGLLALRHGSNSF